MIVLENRIEFLELFAGAAMAGWVCVPLDIKWKKDELKERLAISNSDMIIAERYKLNDISDEEGRIIEIDKWKQIIENYLPTEHIVESLQDAPFIWDLHQDQQERQRHFTCATIVGS